TLEEITNADLMLHVVDASHPNAKAQIEAVRDTLAELEVEHLPEVVALNKVDRLPAGADPAKELELETPAVAISALSGRNVDMLLMAIEASLEQNMLPLTVFLPYNRGDLLSLFYDRGQVSGEEHHGDGVRVHGLIPQRLIPYFAGYTENSAAPEEASGG